MSSPNGINISRLPGVGLQVTGDFRVLRVSHGNQHIYWQPSYQAALRASGPFSAFFPDPSFEGAGTVVVFSRHEGSDEILSRTRSIGDREQLPFAEWARFEHAWTQFKLLALRDDVPEEVRDFIKDFTPPSISQFPDAYRIYKPHWYARPRLLILWGLEPLGGAAFVKPDPQIALQELRARAPSRASVVSSHPWIVALVVLASIAFALLLLWLALPRPRPDFDLHPFVGEPAKADNRTGFEPGLGGFMFGHCDYDWTFADGFPLFSSEDSPEVTWRSDGKKRVSLEARNTILWGFLHKSATLDKEVAVQVRPKKLVQDDAVISRPGLLFTPVGSTTQIDARNPTPAAGAIHVNELPLPGAPADQGAIKMNDARPSANRAAQAKDEPLVPPAQARAAMPRVDKPNASEGSVAGQSPRAEAPKDSTAAKSEPVMPSPNEDGQSSARNNPQGKPQVDLGPKGVRQGGSPSSPLPPGASPKTQDSVAARMSKPASDAKSDPAKGAGSSVSGDAKDAPAQVMPQPGTPLGPIETNGRPGMTKIQPPQITFEVVRQVLDASNKDRHTIGMRFYAPNGVRITKVYVDDSLVSDTASFERKLSVGEHVIQVDYEALNPDGPATGNVRKTLDLGNQVKPEFKISDKTTTTQR